MDKPTVKVEDDAGRRARIKEARQHPFKKGDHVVVGDHHLDTGEVDGVPVCELRSAGRVVEARLHPPHVPEDREATEDDNPSPHCLVELEDERGEKHHVWVSATRLTRGR